jgi:hypothetical protein
VRRCGWCRRNLVRETARRDAVFCSQSCRQAAHRSRIRRAELEVTGGSLRLAYADPPYPGLAARYYGCAEVDHAALLSRLESFDGWALSTSAGSLPVVLALCVAQGLEVRVAAWFRGARPHATARVLSGWEPVVYRGCRRLVGPRVTDVHVGVVPRRRSTLPAAVVGAKPPDFCEWVFRLLGAQVGDTLDDLYPGSGIVGRSWEWYQGRDPSRGDPGDVSLPAGGDASCCSASDASGGAGEGRVGPSGAI